MKLHLFQGSGLTKSHYLTPLSIIRESENLAVLIKAIVTFFARAIIYVIVDQRKTK